MRSRSQTFELPKKSKWRGGPVDSYSFYCPSCRSDRKVPYRSRPGGVRQITQVLAAALFFTLVTWAWFDWKGIVSFVPFWALFETYYRTRMRASLACPHCGFDPYLYMVDVKQARAEIEKHWRAKFAEKGIPYPEKSSGSPLPTDLPVRPDASPLTARDPER